MSKLRDELLCVFDSVFLWEATQRCLKSFVKCTLQTIVGQN